MWEEALMVVILVAIAAHLESSALENARDLMKVGLDRIPKTARRVLNPSIKFTKLTGIQNFSFQPTPDSMLLSNAPNLLSMVMLLKSTKQFLWNWLILAM